jgi:murein DD-endopeptidase MepM/ murein hydrolase activator NlpD
MNNNFGVTLLSALESLSSNTTGKTAGAASSESTFQQALMQFISQMGSTSSNTSSASSLFNPSHNSNSGLSFEMMMIPLLSQLIKLQSGAAPAVAAAPVPMVTTSKSEPTGTPVQGPISQGSHAGHVAIDFAVVVGTPVKATMDGKVVFAGWNNDGYGNLVIVENGSHRTYYAHNSQIPVKVGDTVHSGDVVAFSGTTGHSTGPHVHYETRVNGVCVDPTASLGQG